MLKGYRATTFMDALNTWDALNKEIRCIYKGDIKIFDFDSDWRLDFKVDADIILEGHWYVKV